MSQAGDNLKKWIRERPKLIQELKRRGIRSCEAKLEGCVGHLFCNLAHRHKRWWYIANPDLITEINQVLYLCTPCHQQIEHDEVLTEMLFHELRNLS